VDGHTVVDELATTMLQVGGRAGDAGRSASDRRRVGRKRQQFVGQTTVCRRARPDHSERRRREASETRWTRDRSLYSQGLHYVYMVITVHLSPFQGSSRSRGIKPQIKGCIRVVYMSVVLLRAYKTYWANTASPWCTTDWHLTGVLQCKTDFS